MQYSKESWRKSVTLPTFYVPLFTHNLSKHSKERFYNFIVPDYFSLITNSNQARQYFYWVVHLNAVFLNLTIVFYPLFYTAVPDIILITLLLASVYLYNHIHMLMFCKILLYTLLAFFLIWYWEYFTIRIFFCRVRKLSAADSNWKDFLHDLRHHRDSLFPGNVSSDGRAPEPRC